MILSAFVARLAFCTYVFVVEEILGRDTCCSGADLQVPSSWHNNYVIIYIGDALYCSRSHTRLVRKNTCLDAETMLGVSCAKTTGSRSS